MGQLCPFADSLFHRFPLPTPYPFFVTSRIPAEKTIRSRWLSFFWLAQQNQQFTNPAHCRDFFMPKNKMEVSRLKKLKERLKRGLALMIAAASIVSVLPSMNVSAASQTAKITFAYCHDGAGNAIRYQQTVTHDGRVCGEAGEARTRIYAA